MTSNTNAEGILQEAVDQLVRERDELRAENKRLRAALERAWQEHERIHAYCSVFSPGLERAAVVLEALAGAQG